MNRRLAPCFALLAAVACGLFASTAFAQGGINLSWDECGSAGVLQKNFACDTNSGFAIMYGSVVTGHDMPMLNGHEGVIDMQTNVANLSDWWQLGTGGCRYNYIQENCNFVTFPAPACADPWLGVALSAMNYQAPFSGYPNRARIRTVCGNPEPIHADASTEYYLFTIWIGFARSTGLGSCAGCTDGACFVFASARVTQPSKLSSYLITSPQARSHVIWQPGGSEIGTRGCPGQLPARAPTWGQVKSLYR